MTNKVEQSGAVTPRHLVGWVTDGVIYDIGSAGAVFSATIVALAEPLSGDETVFGTQSANNVIITSQAIADLAFEGSALAGLPAVTSLDGSEIFYTVQAGTDKQATALNLRTITATTFANLPGSPVVGMLGCVNNCSTQTWGANADGAGAFKVLVWWNGSNWTVLGK